MKQKTAVKGFTSEKTQKEFDRKVIILVREEVFLSYFNEFYKVEYLG